MIRLSQDTRYCFILGTRSSPFGTILPVQEVQSFKIISLAPSNSAKKN